MFYICLILCDLDWWMKPSFPGLAASRLQSFFSPPKRPHIDESTEWGGGGGLQGFVDGQLWEVEVRHA